MPDSCVPSLTSFVFHEILFHVRQSLCPLLVLHIALLLQTIESHPCCVDVHAPRTTKQTKKKKDSLRLAHSLSLSLDKKTQRDERNGNVRTVAQSTIEMNGTMNIPFANIGNGDSSFTSSTAATSTDAKTSSRRNGDRVEIRLAIYDLSRGWASLLSPFLFCTRKISLVPHTGILYGDREYFWGGGIKCMSHQAFVDQGKLEASSIVSLGYTDIDIYTFHDFLRGVASKYTADTYSLLDHNCNHFTSECAKFLIGRDIPEHIRHAPKIVKRSCSTRCWLFLYGISPVRKRFGWLVWSLLLAVCGVAICLSITSSESSGCEPRDANVNFAIFVFFFEATISCMLALRLGRAVMLRKRTCCVPGKFMEVILALLLTFWEYTAAVSLSSAQVSAHHHLPAACDYDSSANYRLMTAATMTAWLLSFLWPFRVILLRINPVVECYVKQQEKEDRGGLLDNNRHHDNATASSDVSFVPVPVVEEDEGICRKEPDDDDVDGVIEIAV